MAGGILVRIVPSESDTEFRSFVALTAFFEVTGGVLNKYQI